MGKFKIKQEITAYEKDGGKTYNETIEINSHPSYTRMVVLVIGDQSRSVVGSDIIAAVNNAMNSGKP